PPPRDYVPPTDINVPEFEAPRWLKDAQTYLCSLNLGGAWQNAVLLWMQMEKSMGPTSAGRLGCVETRPEELSKWVTSGHCFDKIPSVEEAKTYGTIWMSWWRALQPKWRQSTSAKASLPAAVYEHPSNDWTSLKKGGPVGFVVVLTGLAMWGTAAPR
ncbi:hypothetical protein CERSUDRAFT_34420, partial [Gelatoporia subvermispora B]